MAEKVNDAAAANVLMGGLSAWHVIILVMMGAGFFIQHAVSRTHMEDSIQVLHRDAQRLESLIQSNSERILPTERQVTEFNVKIEHLSDSITDLESKIDYIIDMIVTNQQE